MKKQSLLIMIQFRFKTQLRSGQLDGKSTDIPHEKTKSLWIDRYGSSWVTCSFSELSPEDKQSHQAETRVVRRGFSYKPNLCS